MKDECLICGEPLKYSANEKQMECAVCHKKENSKNVEKIPTPDIAVSMGCDVGCPFIGRAFDDDWGLPDPTGKSDDEFITVITEIENKIKSL